MSLLTNISIISIMKVVKKTALPKKVGPLTPPRSQRIGTRSTPTSSTSSLLSLRSGRMIANLTAADIIPNIVQHTTSETAGLMSLAEATERKLMTDDDKIRNAIINALRINNCDETNNDNQLLLDDTATNLEVSFNDSTAVNKQ